MVVYCSQVQRSFVRNWSYFSHCALGWFIGFIIVVCEQCCQVLCGCEHCQVCFRGSIANELYGAVTQVERRVLYQSVGSVL